MERDRESIGLTSESQTILVEIEERGWFVDGQDAARFCMAYAIRAKAPEGTTIGTETRWAAGNFDKTGEIRFRHMGYSENIDATYRREIAQLLEER